VDTSVLFLLNESSFASLLIANSYDFVFLAFTHLDKLMLSVQKNVFK